MGIGVIQPLDEVPSFGMRFASVAERGQFKQQLANSILFALKE